MTAAWLCFTVAVICFIAVALIVREGGRWRFAVGIFSISAGNPVGRLWYGAAALILWHILRKGIWHDWRAWARLSGQVALLSASVYVSMLIGERLVRHVLRNRQSLGTIQDMKYYSQGTEIKVRAKHPLALITHVSPCRRIVYELRPGMTMEFGRTRFRTNSDGMRDDYEYAKGDHPGVKRIVGIGDSGMFGWAVHQEESYLSVLEESLAEKYGRGACEVLNMAVPGYNTFQEVEMLRHKGLAYKPDIVVLGWCENDFDIPFFLQRRREYREKDVSYLYLMLFNRSRLREITRPVVLNGHEIDRNMVDPEILSQSGPEGVFRSLKSLRQMSEEYGFRVLVFGPLGQNVAKMCEASGLDYFDTYSIPRDELPSEPIHGFHPRAIGHRYLAERLDRIMTERGWLPQVK